MSGDYYRSLVKNIHDGIVLLDQDGKVTFANLAAEDILGYSSDSLAGKSIFELISELVYPDDVLRTGSQFERLLKNSGLFQHDEFRIKLPDGVRWLEIRASNKLADPEIKAIVVDFYDISYRMQIQESLRESESRYRKLVELDPDIVFVHVNDKLVFVNASAVTLLGANTADDLIGKSVFDIIHPDYHEVVRERIAGLLHTGKPAPYIEERFIRLDGRAIDVEVAATPFRFHHEPAIQVVARDISIRKEVERARTEFISIASHQLRTPLSSLRWLVESMQASLGKLKLGPQERLNLDDIDVLITRMILTVENLLALSLFDVGATKVKLKELDIIKFTAGFLKTLAPYLKQRKHSVVFSKPARIPRVYIDEQMLYNIMHNLVSNAVDYSPSNTVITIDIRQDGDFVRVGVASKGEAISKEDQQRLFQKFYRTDEARKMRTAGSGLGLFMVRSLVQSIGGSVGVDSQEGKDTIFYFTVPASAGNNNHK